MSNRQMKKGFHHHIVLLVSEVTHLRDKQTLQTHNESKYSLKQLQYILLHTPSHRLTRRRKPQWLF
jgi:hypothetical protein